MTSGSGSVTTDTTAPTLSGVSISSNNESNTLAKDGDDITLTFTASEAISTPVVTFQSGGAAITDGSIVYNNTSGNTWTAVYTADANDTDGAVSYSIAFSDTAGNAGSAVTSGSGSVTTDTTAPTLSNVSIASDNSTSTLAKAGDDVTLTFTASESISTPTVTFASGGSSINGNVTVQNTSGNTWTAVYTADANDTDGAVSYSIAFSDTAGNAGSAVTSGSGSVTTDTTAPTLSNVSIASDNSTSTLAKAGDDVTLTFTASESISTPTVTFASGGSSINGNVTVQNTSGNTWTAVYTADANDTDGAVSYSIAFSDTAGNAGSAVTSGSGSVTTDTTAPTLSNVSIASDNSTSTLAKAGDDITLTFTASEAISTPVVTFQSGGAAITDGSIVYNNTSGNTWTAVYTADANDTDGAVSYSIAFSDTAGNAGSAVTSGSGSVTTDTTAPTLSNVSIASDNSNSTLAKAGDDVTLTFTASERFNTNSDICIRRFLHQWKRYCSEYQWEHLDSGLYSRCK